MTVRLLHSHGPRFCCLLGSWLKDSEVVHFCPGDQERYRGVSGDCSQAWPVLSGEHLGGAVPGHWVQQT